MDFAGRFAHLFNTRGDSGERHARTYLKGLLTNEPAKNMERMAEVIEGTTWQNLQQFISDTKWNELALWDDVASCANRRLGGHRDSVLIIDESAEAKQGKHSVGVARQYNGRLGKTDNCQVGVYSVLARGTEATLVGARLFLPDEWVEDKERCQKAGIPEDQIISRSKIDLAKELIDQALDQELDIKGVCFDSFYGRDQTLIAEVAGLGLRVVADIPCDTMVWTEKPAGSVRPGALGRSGALRVDKAVMPELTTVTLRSAENGPVVAQVAAIRVWIWPSVCEAPSEWWLLQMVQSDGTRKWTLINAPDNTPLPILARWQGQRFFVEQTFKNAKSHVGAGDYQLRKWRGWHHHMALVGLALLFLLEEKQDCRASIPLLSAADITEMLDYYFARPRSAGEVVDRIQERHRRRRQATESKCRAAKKRRLPSVLD